MKINIHAGHNPDGKIACGSVGLIKESTEARKVKDEVARQLRQLGHTVYDCTCENGMSQNNVLASIVSSCNLHAVDLDVSVHFNSCVNDYAGDGKTTGAEVHIFSTDSKARPYAEKVCKAISGLGLRNRGVKISPNLYFLKRAKSPAMLIECCFVDDADDIKFYNYKSMATAIVYGITGKKAPGIKFELDKTYTAAKDCYLRIAPGAGSVKAHYSGLSNALKLKCRIASGGYAKFKKGKKFHLTEIRYIDSDIWGRMKSGFWVPMVYKGKTRAK